MKTTAAVHTVHNTIPNPFQPGQRIRIPGGTLVRTTNPRHNRAPVETRRAHTVRLVTATDGWVDLWDDSGRGVGFVHLPTVSWAGSGGYWHDVKVTPELCDALGVVTPPLPDVSRDYMRLDVEPGYGVGYDDRLG